jgi:predicted acetyltransferase
LDPLIPHTYRPMQAEDTPRVAWLLSQAFGRAEEQSSAWISATGITNMRVMARPGREADACAMLVPMGLFVGGASVPQFGVAAVSTAPEVRGEGVAIRMIEDALREMHTRGAGVSTLYPALLKLYRRAGYEQAGSRFEITIDTTRLRPAREDRALPIRRMTDADRQTIRRVYSERARFDTGMLDRGDYVWGRVFAPANERTQGWVVEENGEITGWLVHYRKMTPGDQPFPDFDLMLTDVHAFTNAAARRVMALLADESSLWRRAKLFGGPHHPLISVMPELAFKVRLTDYWMLRMVDVARALESRGYPMGLTTRLGLDVDDELMPHNHGTFVLHIEGGKGNVTRGGAPAPTLHLGVRELAAIYTGFMSPRRASVAGWVEGTDEALALADAAFASGAPAMGDFF